MNDHGLENILLNESLMETETKREIRRKAAEIVGEQTHEAVLDIANVPLLLREQAG